MIPEERELKQLLLLTVEETRNGGSSLDGCLLGLLF
jgi:hypothetical protein